ncbi:MAG: YraN family protein [Cocleimonas sp.]|nr:YraN family protein [Cocleimonas sp.]
MTIKQLSLFVNLSKKLTSRKKRGNKAEQQACKHLQNNGLTLLEKNFSTKAGEVDLIMRDGETLVFVEVRYRKNTDYGGAAASVTVKKQQRIIKAALAYQQKHLPQSSMRFDVVAIEGDNGDIDWITSAFDGF